MALVVTITTTLYTTLAATIGRLFALPMAVILRILIILTSRVFLVPSGKSIVATIPFKVVAAARRVVKWVIVRVIIFAWDWKRLIISPKEIIQLY